MRVFVAGATGFIGRALVPLLHREGHSVVAWVRSEASARSRLGADVELVSTDASVDELVSAIERCDAVVNLAGEPVMGGRWTAARRTILEDSRIQLTSYLVRALTAAAARPAVFISGSAVGYYGDRAEGPLTETSSAGDDFLARLCRQWEDAAQQAEAIGLRVIRLRTGVVLGRAGGALAQMLPPFELGLGGPVGSGKQYLPWIHLHDLAKIIAVALVDNRYRGPINGVAPQQATGRSFARVLGRALHRPAIVPVPALVLRAVFGEAATVLLASQRVEPIALGQLGFGFEFPTLDSALEDLVGNASVTISPAQSRPDGAEEAWYQLQTRTVVAAPLEETFAFFSKAANLGLITPASMQFRIQGQVPPMTQDATIDYRLRLGPVPVRWSTRIAKWEPGRRFVDRQEVGPYRLWWHEHTFQADGERTVMEDRVYYAPPLGILGRLAHRLFIGSMLKKIFQYRGDVIRLRFGTAGRQPEVTATSPARAVQHYEDADGLRGNRQPLVEIPDAAFKAAAKATQARYGTKSQAATRLVRNAAATVAAIASSKTTISTSAPPGECKPKKTHDQSAFSRSWAPQSARAFVDWPRCFHNNSQRPRSRRRAPSTPVRRPKPVESSSV